MTKLDRVTSRVTCFTAENVNTDQIIPARFLKRIDKTGFGNDLFADMKPPEVCAFRRSPASDPALRSKLRMRQFARTRGVGAAGFWLSRADLHVVCRYLQGELAEERRPHDRTRRSRLTESSSRLSRNLPMRNDGGPALSRPSSLAAFRRSFRSTASPKTCLLEGLDELGYILRHEPQIAAFEKAR